MPQWIYTEQSTQSARYRPFSSFILLLFQLTLFFYLVRSILFSSFRWPLKWHLKCQYKSKLTMRSKYKLIVHSDNWSYIWWKTNITNLSVVQHKLFVVYLKLKRKTRQRISQKINWKFYLELSRVQSYKFVVRGWSYTQNIIRTRKLSLHTHTEAVAAIHTTKPWQNMDFQSAMETFAEAWVAANAGAAQVSHFFSTGILYDKR